MYTVLEMTEPTKPHIKDFVHEGPGDLMQELVDLHERLTGHRVEFATIEEAKEKCSVAVADRYFAEPKKIRPPWLKEDGSPTVEQEEEDLGDPVFENADNLGPVGKARLIFDAMWGHPRKDIIEMCRRAGIKDSTASTQYQHYKKARETAEAGDDRNPETGMPRLPPGVRIEHHDR